MIWQERAACRGQDVELFFAREFKTALQVCLGCEVAAECLAEALRHEGQGVHAYGVWGGMTPEQRVLVRRGRAVDNRRTCKGCGKAFITSWVKDKQTFCSTTCGRKWRYQELGA